MLTRLSLAIRLPPVDTRPPLVDTRPPPVDTRPPPVDTRPPPVDTHLPPVIHPVLLTLTLTLDLPRVSYMMF